MTFTGLMSCACRRACEQRILDGADGGFALRRSKKYAVPSSPLLLRQFHRLVIDEAQAVQSKAATPTQLARMALRIGATNRWCVTGTPFSTNFDQLINQAKFLDHSSVLQRN